MPEKKSFSSDCLNILIVTNNPIKRSGLTRSSAESAWWWVASVCY